MIIPRLFGPVQPCRLSVLREVTVADRREHGQGQDVQTLVDPCWFPEGFDPHRDEFSFVATDRQQLATNAFLDGRWNRTGARHLRASAKDVLPHAVETHTAPGIVWHTGFCCSTLLARALDQPGANLSLCEPQVLVDIAEAQRTQLLSGDAVSVAVRRALFLLSRPFAPNERVTLKPSPAANSLLPDAAKQTAGPMLFLFSDCTSFVISICRMGEQGRKYVRRLFLALLADGHAQGKWPVPKLLSLSDLELAAIVWHMQIAEFLRVWPGLGRGRAASLDCDAFLAQPEETLVRTDRFFSLGIGANRLREMAAAPLFRRNAKTGEDAFDASRRREEHARVAEQMADDLKRIVAQSYEICRSTPRAAPLPDPLLPIDKSYCP